MVHVPNCRYNAHWFLTRGLDDLDLDTMISWKFLGLGLGLGFGLLDRRLEKVVQQVTTNNHGGATASRAKHRVVDIGRHDEMNKRMFPSNK